MTERPILFKGRLVRAILRGRKTQTRRVINSRLYIEVKTEGDHVLDVIEQSDPNFGKIAMEWLRCPYGVPGDRLWVRESFRLRLDQDNVPPSKDWWKSHAWYQADSDSLGPTGCGGGPGKLRPSIFMPRWASRINLEVIAVRVERLRDIGEIDAAAEGAVPSGCTHPDCDARAPCAGLRYRPAFAGTWDEINAKRGYSWQSNPFVWVIEFEKIRP